MTMKVASASEDDLLPTSAFLDDIALNTEEEEDAGVLVDQPPHGTNWRSALTRKK